jgi:hypothetical protein
VISPARRTSIGRELMAMYVLAILLAFLVVYSFYAVIHPERF